MIDLEDVIERAVRKVLREELSRLREDLLLPRSSVDAAEAIGLAECAHISGYSVDTLRRWIRSGKLPAVKGDKSWRVRRGDLNEAMGKSNGPVSVVELDARVTKMLSRHR